MISGDAKMRFTGPGTAQSLVPTSEWRLDWDMKTFAHCFPAAASRAYGARVELEAGLEPATC